MLVALQTLMKVGYCVSNCNIVSWISLIYLVPQREMPVFGIVHDQVVTGIIVCAP